jgi:hypothetical protein
MSCILGSMKRKPNIPRDALAGTIVCGEMFDRLTIDGDRKIARAPRASCINKNVRDVRAITQDVKACSTTNLRFGRNYKQ